MQRRKNLFTWSMLGCGWNNIADIFLEVVLTIMNLLLIINNYFNITVVTMKWIEHNFISRQLVVNEKYKKVCNFLSYLKKHVSSYIWIKNNKMQNSWE